MVRSPKSIAGAVEVALGNAPYKIAFALFVISDQAAILILRFHDIKTLAPRGVNNS
ncbi:MAG: hypothetical protein ACKPIF_29325 [Microcystis panniformis]